MLRWQEICDDPQLFVGTASRTDVNQGILGKVLLINFVDSQYAFTKHFYLFFVI